MKTNLRKLLVCSFVLFCAASAGGSVTAGDISDEFDSPSLGAWWNLDCPGLPRVRLVCLGFGWYDHCWWATESGLGGKVSLDTANKRLDIMCPNWRAFNMWSERGAAPIAWTAAPA